MLGDIFYFKLSTFGELMSTKTPLLCVSLKKMEPAKTIEASIWMPCVSGSSPIVYAGAGVSEAATLRDTNVSDFVLSTHKKNLDRNSEYDHRITVEETTGNELFKEFMRVQKVMYIQDGVIGDIYRILKEESDISDANYRLEAISMLLFDFHDLRGSIK